MEKVKYFAEGLSGCFVKYFVENLSGNYDQHFQYEVKVLKTAIKLRN